MLCGGDAERIATLSHLLGTLEQVTNRFHSKLVAAGRPYLRDGEQVQAALSASTRPQKMQLAVVVVAVAIAVTVPRLVSSSVVAVALLGGTMAGAGMLAYLLATPSRIVLATDQRIVVLRCRQGTAFTPDGVLRELPRATRIDGPGTRVENLGEPLWAHPQSRSESAAADAALG